MARYYQPTTGVNTEAKYMPLNLDFMNNQVAKLGEQHRNTVAEYNKRVGEIGDLYSYNSAEKEIYFLGQVLYAPI